MSQDFKLIESILWAAHPFWPDTFGETRPHGCASYSDYLFTAERLKKAAEVSVHAHSSSAHNRFFLLERHRKRMERSAAELGFKFNKEGFNELVTEAEKTILKDESCHGNTPGNFKMFKVRLTLTREGDMEYEFSPVSPLETLPVRFDISSCHAEDATPLPSHKTTLRRQLNIELERAMKQGLFDTLFVSRAGEITEGTITNLFVDTTYHREDNRLLTPPLVSGLLPGTLRAELIDRGLAREHRVTPAMLKRARALYLGNSVRGLVPAVPV